MLPISLKIIISAVVFCIGALMGIEFIRAGQRVTRSYWTNTYKDSPQKRIQRISIIVVSTLIGAIAGPLLAPISDIEWFGVILAGGMMIVVISYALQKVMN